MRKPKAKDNLFDREWLPMERLWWRVVVKALEDGDRRWFEKGNRLSDFDLICEDLGVRVDAVRNWCLQVVDDGRGKEIKRLIYGRVG